MSRSLVAAALLALLPLSAVPSAEAGPTPDAVQAARSKATYHATIRWTEHGIPHITAANFGDLGFGSGYAAAGEATCTLYDTVVTARGQRSLIFGPDQRYNDQVTLDATNLQVDTVVGDLHNRKVVEGLLADKVRGPGEHSRQMVRGYVAGINTWIREHHGHAEDPGCSRLTMKPDVEPIDLWYGIYLANLLGSTGVFVSQIADAAPPSLTDPGLPTLPLRASAVDRDRLLAGLGRDPEKGFGSNATAVGGDDTSTKRGMLLGNPHFPWLGRYRFTQQHLTIPGRYDVAGASLIGSPVVNIGWNKNVAWSHTVSTAYRFTPYEYHLLGPTTYLTDSGPVDLEHREVQVRTKGGTTVTTDLYRTPQGYVIDAPDQLMPWGVASVWAIRDANAEQLRTLDTFLDMGKARNVRDLLRKQDAGAGMPWVNTTAADRFGDVLYADHSVVPNVSDALAQQCMTPTGRVLDQVAGLPGLDGTFADSSCAWGTDADAERPGILGPKNLPSVVRRDWVMNANDSYWLPNPASPLEGYAGIIGCERCVRTMRTRMVSRYVIDRIAGGRKETPASLRSHEYDNRVMAAEVMREDGALDAVCDQTGETDACAALKKWDGHSDATSRGYHLFLAFVEKLPTVPLGLADTVWTTPFDANDPLNTPGGLNTGNPQVVQAMQEAIDEIRASGAAFDAPWGSIQIAGDRGAPLLALGGGEGDDTGNANALAPADRAQNAGSTRRIVYGSSHIQAISFLDGGRLDAHTILTYSQFENPRSPFSSDQTKLFAQEKWVRFAWTPAQIRHDLIRTQRISG